ncbi:MAG: 2-oxoglutarate and iron-dependent oxygenase domain-containing protein [Ilumatobacteraceae bacterium]
MRHLPVIDVSALRTACADPQAVVSQIDQACRLDGFFLVSGHGVDKQLAEDLEALSRTFFALPDSEKSLISMEHAGTAWRGWFPLGGEVTSGVADQKEGLYFGTELDASDPRVRDGLPLHGPNLFPARPSGMRNTVLRWMNEVSLLGGDLIRGIALGLGIEENWFAQNLTTDPTILFRIFSYPPAPKFATSKWGVGEHTDYGLLTMLWQDNSGGLEVFSAGEWLAVEPQQNTFVCNIGDMLEKLTNGVYRSTPHRVRNVSGRDRLSFPLFYDPSWNSHVVPLPIPEVERASETRTRWDGEEPLAWDGMYGDYLTKKVSKAFPKLFQNVIAKS